MFTISLDTEVFSKGKALCFSLPILGDRKCRWSAYNGYTHYRGKKQKMFLWVPKSLIKYENRFSQHGTIYQVMRVPKWFCEKKIEEKTANKRFFMETGSRVV